MKLAQTVGDLGKITPPDVVNKMNAGDVTGATGVNTLISTVINLFFVFAGLVFVVMVVWGAVDFIISFGEKDAIGKARQKITWAIIGIIILSLIFVLLRIVERLTGLTFIVN